MNRRAFNWLLAGSIAPLLTSAHAQVLRPVKLLLVRRPGLSPTNECVTPCIRGRLYDVSDLQAPIGTIVASTILGRAAICDVLERPQASNKPKSSIPKGIYPAFARTDNPEHKKWLEDPAKAWRLELKNTNPRSQIQFHYGTDVSWSVGCFIVGAVIQASDGQGITSSYCRVSNADAAIARLRAAVEGAGIDSKEIRIAIIDAGDAFPGMAVPACT